MRTTTGTEVRPFGRRRAGGTAFGYRCRRACRGAGRGTPWGQPCGQRLGRARARRRKRYYLYVFPGTACLRLLLGPPVRVRLDWRLGGRQVAVSISVRGKEKMGGGKSLPARSLLPRDEAGGSPAGGEGVADADAKISWTR